MFPVVTSKPLTHQMSFSLLTLFTVAAQFHPIVTLLITLILLSPLSFDTTPTFLPLKASHVTLWGLSGLNCAISFSAFLRKSTIKSRKLHPFFLYDSHPLLSVDCLLFLLTSYRPRNRAYRAWKQCSSSKSHSIFFIIRNSCEKILFIR